jgi:hypothetical protein
MKISKKTIIKYFKAFRELCSDDLDLNNFQIGGPGVIVEINESLMAKVKHYRGKDLKRKQIWVFGLKERGELFKLKFLYIDLIKILGRKKAIFRVVEARGAENLIPMILQHVRPGSIIMSDCWRAYANIYKHGYIHHQVNHSLHFVNPESIDKGKF